MKKNFFLNYELRHLIGCNYQTIRQSIEENQNLLELDRPCFRVQSLNNIGKKKNFFALSIKAKTLFE